MDCPEDADIISRMDAEFVEGAVKGNISVFNACGEPLDLLLTPIQNTVLHIHITARTRSEESIQFINEILHKCPSLLFQCNTRDETPLHIAARYGHHDVVKELIGFAKFQHEDLERGAEAAREMVRKLNKEKDTALHEAVRYNRVQVVRILTTEDPDFCYLANQAGETPLYIAAERGYHAIVSQILQSCTSVEYGGPNGRTAMHEAAINGSTETMKKLLEKKKILTKKMDEQGWTPLHHASFFGRLTIVRKLLEADKYAAYIRDSDGRTALHIAASKGNNYFNVLKTILSSCPDCCEIVDERGRNVLHLAVERYKSKGLNHLLQNPICVNLINQKDNEGNTPLHVLASCGFACSALIRHPLADIRAVNNNNLTALDVLDATKTLSSRASRVATRTTLKNAGCRRSKRKRIRLFTEDRKERIERVANMISELMKAKEAHLIVATLIATVTFAAGFAIPGGYINDHGTAILSSRPAFRSFFISNGLALLLSTSAVFIHFLLAIKGNKRKLLDLFIVSFYLIAMAMILMVVAFASGTFVVLPHSSNYRNSTWIISASFFLFFFLIILYIRCGPT